MIQYSLSIELKILDSGNAVLTDYPMLDGLILDDGGDQVAEHPVCDLIRCCAIGSEGSSTNKFDSKVTFSKTTNKVVASSDFFNDDHLGCMFQTPNTIGKIIKVSSATEVLLNEYTDVYSGVTGSVVGTNNTKPIIDRLVQYDTSDINNNGVDVVSSSNVLTITTTRSFKFNLANNVNINEVMLYPGVKDNSPEPFGYGYVESLPPILGGQKLVVTAKLTRTWDASPLTKDPFFDIAATWDLTGVIANHKGFEDIGVDGHRISPDDSVFPPFEPSCDYLGVELRNDLDALVREYSAVSVYEKGTNRRFWSISTDVNDYIFPSSKVFFTDPDKNVSVILNYASEQTATHKYGRTIEFELTWQIVPPSFGMWFIAYDTYVMNLSNGIQSNEIAGDYFDERAVVSEDGSKLFMFRTDPAALNYLVEDEEPASEIVEFSIADTGTAVDITPTGNVFAIGESNMRCAHLRYDGLMLYGVNIYGRITQMSMTVPNDLSTIKVEAFEYLEGFDRTTETIMSIGVTRDGTKMWALCHINSTLTYKILNYNLTTPHKINSAVKLTDYIVNNDVDLGTSWCAQAYLNDNETHFMIVDSANKVFIQCKLATPGDCGSGIVSYRNVVPNPGVIGYFGWASSVVGDSKVFIYDSYAGADTLWRYETGVLSGTDNVTPAGGVTTWHPTFDMRAAQVFDGVVCVESNSDLSILWTFDQVTELITEYSTSGGDLAKMSPTGKTLDLAIGGGFVYFFQIIGSKLYALREDASTNLFLTEYDLAGVEDISSYTKVGDLDLSSIIVGSPSTFSIIMGGTKLLLMDSVEISIGVFNDVLREISLTQAGSITSAVVVSEHDVSDIHPYITRILEDGSGLWNLTENDLIQKYEMSTPGDLTTLNRVPTKSWADLDTTEYVDGFILNSDETIVFYHDDVAFREAVTVPIIRFTPPGNIGLQSDGSNVYIDLPFSAAGTFDFEIDAQFTSASYNTSQISGSMDTSNTRTDMVGITSGLFKFAWGPSATDVTMQANLGRNIWSKAGATFSIDNQVLRTDCPDLGTGNPLSLFMRNETSGGTPSHTYPSKLLIYGAKFWSDTARTTLLADLHPVPINATWYSATPAPSDCFWDEVSGSYLEPIGGVLTTVVPTTWAGETVPSGEVLTGFTTGESDTNAMMMTNDRIFTGTYSGRVASMDVYGGNKVVEKLGISGGVRSLAWDDNYFYVGVDSGEIKRFDHSWNEIDVLADLPSRAAGMHHNNGTIWVVNESNTLYRVNTTDGSYVTTPGINATRTTGVHSFGDIFVTNDYLGSFRAININAISTVLWTEYGISSIFDDFVFDDNRSCFWCLNKNGSIQRVDVNLFEAYLA